MTSKSACSHSRLLSLATAAALVLATMHPASAQSATPKPRARTFDCKPVPKPVMGLDFGSRYTDDSSDRSDIDEESNADVNASLKPIEEYISAMSKMANSATLDETHRSAQVGCVVDWLYAWADADALSGLSTLSAKIAIPARFAGIAAAYRQVKSLGGIDNAKQAVIERWLIDRVGKMVVFFDTEAPPKASRNNLRLWAGFAAMETGLATQNQDLVAWGRDTNEMAVCEASADGSLPLEMGRGRLALHYQLHALGPMMMTAALLEQNGEDGFGICEGKIATIATFTLNAVKDPTIVDKLAGKVQSFSTKKEKLRSYQMAWAEPYLRYNSDAELEHFIGDLRPLAHAKLGGNLTAIFMAGG